MNMADTCQGHAYNACLHYAMSSWSPGGGLLLAVIVVAIVAFIKR